MPRFTFWADDDSKVSGKDQEILCNYAYVTIVQYLSKNFTIVYGPGPDVLRLQAALSDARPPQSCAVFP